VLAESCEATLNPCCPQWTGCAHVHDAGTTGDGRARFIGDDGTIYEAHRQCGPEFPPHPPPAGPRGECSDHCPGGVCRPGVIPVPDTIGCSCISGPPVVAPYECVLSNGACQQVPRAPAPDVVPTTS
jgi:hypothetical protein